MATVILTNASVSPWSVPADFLVAGHTVQLLGPGGNGAVGTSGASNTSGAGGGSGGYARLTYSSGTVTPGTTTIAFVIPAGGAGASNPTVWQTSTNGQTAGSGGNAATTTAGGAGPTGALVGAPTIVYTLTANFAGAAGGAGSGSTSQGGGGGAGSAGPAAAGGTGSANVTSAGGGGGGANNGASGNATASTTGGTGSSGTGGTTANPGNPGSGNSGGGGGSTSSVAGTNVTGGLGGTGTDFVAAGCGGGGGGSGANTATSGVVNSHGGNAGGFGGGGGGCGGLRSTGTPTFTVGTGTGGLIVINFGSLLQQHTQITRFDAGPPVRPGQPERWKPFFDLANQPPVVTPLFRGPYFTRYVTPKAPEEKSNRTFFDLSTLYAQHPVGAQWEEQHRPVPRPGSPELWRPFFDLSNIPSSAQAPFVYYDFSAHPLPPLPVPNVIAQLNLPQVYSAAPVGDILVEVHPPAPRGNPEPWKSFFDLSSIYAQAPVGDTQVETHPPAPRGNPERWRPFFDLASIYSQSPVGATSVETHAPAVKGNPEFWETILNNQLPIIYSAKPIGATSIDAAHPVVRGQPERWRPFFDLSSIYAQGPVSRYLPDEARPLPVAPPPWVPPWLLETTLGTVTIVLPFVYYDFSNHPPPPLPVPNVAQQLSLPQVYSASPIGATSVEVHPLILPAPPAPPKTFFDLSIIYAQAPVGDTSIEVHPLAPRGNPEPWKSFFDLSVIYSQHPVGAGLLTYHTTPLNRTPEWIPPYLLTTTLGIIVVIPPFVYYDFSNHPPPPLPVPNVIAQLSLPQVYAQGPVSRYLPDEARPLPVAPPPWVPPWLLETTLAPITAAPFVYYDFSAHPLPPLPVPNVIAQLNLPQVYSQKPVGQARLSFEATPVVRGQPERWKSFIDLSQIYTATPVGTALLTTNRTPPAQPAENVLYPDLVLLHGIAPPPPPTGVAFYMAGMFSSMALFPYLGEIPRFEGTGSTPANAYFAEDGATFYVAEDGTTFYVQE